MNAVDNFMYHEFNGSKHIFLILYVDDILVAYNDKGLLHGIKRFLSNTFKMKDLDDVFCVRNTNTLRSSSRYSWVIKKELY